MHTITMTPNPGPVGVRGRYYTYSSPGLAPYTGGPNGLREFCRKMIEAGLQDHPAQVIGEDGKSRLFVRSIAGAGTKDRRETDKGFSLVTHDPAANPFSEASRRAARAS